MTSNSSKNGVLDDVKKLLQKDYRGVNIAIYGVATLGLAAAIHHVRPISKFSKATRIPNHFIKKQEPLTGKFVGLEHSPVRLLVEHQAPIYVPLWHSKKPPLPVKLWGVDIKSGNAVSWLQCVANGQTVTLKPVARDEDSLVSVVTLHFPVDKKSKSLESLDLGKKLVELGFATTSLPIKLRNKSEAQVARQLISAESYAKNHRLGVWSSALPPLPVYIIFWRKASKQTQKLLYLTYRFLYQLLILTYRGVKSIPWKALLPSKTTVTQPKVQTIQ